MIKVDEMNSLEEGFMGRLEGVIRTPY